MEDLTRGCKSKLGEFRVKELRDVLSRLGLPKHGSKRDLLARILDLFTSEQVPSTSASTSATASVDGNVNVVKAIDDVYGCMLEEEYEIDSERGSRPKISCICGVSAAYNNRTDYMVECGNPDCRVLQHKTCVLGLGPAPPHFYCEVCRINRADPIGPDEINFDTKLDINSEDMYLIEHKGYKVEVWSILLNDVFQFRMCWPKYGYLKVNGVVVNCWLATSDRNNGALISSMYLKEGANEISISAVAEHDGIYCMGVRLVKPRSVQEVCTIISNKQGTEPLNVATDRVIHCLTGGGALDDAGKELEVLAATVDLRCPISGARMKTASRFMSCIHIGCFDLESFIGLAHTTRNWKCPICLNSYSWEDITVDSYFNQVLREIEQSGADTTEIKIRPDGSWFANNEPNTPAGTNSIRCDLSSTSGITNYGASLSDPIIISDDSE
ncbi:hypothetical protein ACET3Z_020030 [Daucus carota]